MNDCEIIESTIEELVDYVSDSVGENQQLQAFRVYILILIEI